MQITLKEFLRLSHKKCLKQICAKGRLQRTEAKENSKPK